MPSVRHAWRSLRRTPAFAGTAIATLTIGIGAPVAIFAVVNAILLRPLPYGTPDRLVDASHDLAPLSITHAGQTSATFFAYRKFARTLDGIGVYQQSAVNVTRPGAGADPQRLACAYVSAEVLPVLGVSPARGRVFTAAEDLPHGPDVVILSNALWQSAFGADPQVVGRRLDVNGVTREIVGVMPATFRFPDADTELWLPLALDPGAPFPGGFNYTAIARLKAGVTADAAQRDLAAVLPRVVEIAPNLAPGISTQMLLDQAKPVPTVTPLRDRVVGDFAGTLWAVAAAAGLVLLVACFNAANLILVRADSRQRELAVREALGAGRARVLAHFLAESAVLAAIAGALGTGAAWVAVRALVASDLSAASGVAIPRLAEVRVDGATILFALALSALVAVVCSAIPALRVGRAELATTLREGGRTGTSGRARHRVRATLVVGQIALALVALASSGLLLRTFQRLHSVDLGFAPDHVATLWLSPPRSRYASDTAVVQFYNALRTRVAALPGVRSVGLSSRIPFEGRGMNQDPFYAEGDVSAAQKIPHLQVFTTVDDGYFRTMGIPVVAGRGFDAIDRQRSDEAVISLGTAEQFWHDPTGRAAVGRRFSELPGGRWVTVVGVVGNVRDTALAAPPSQTVYYPEVVQRDTLFSQFARTMAIVVRTTGEPVAITRAVQQVVRDLDPTLPTFDVRPMTAVLGGSLARLSFTIIVLGAAAVATLLLGAVGLYGVMAYLVRLRTRELGVRIALGARPGAVAAMLTREGVGLTLVGVVGGLAVFAFVSRFLRAFLFGVTATDPVALAGAAVLLVVIATLASWIPARRAARLDPASTLRAE